MNRIHFLQIIRSLLFLCAFTAYGVLKAGTLERLADSTKFVYDKANILPRIQFDSLEKKLAVYHDTSGNKMVILIEKSIGNTPIMGYAKEMFQEFGMSENSQGISILIMLVIDQGLATIHTGQGLKGALSDSRCAQITNQILIPSFKMQQYYEGINEAIRTLAGTINGEYKLKPVLNPEYSFKSFIVPVIVFLLFLGVAVYLNLRAERNLRNTMHSFGISYTSARILSGLDRPEVTGGGWNTFDGGGTAGGW